MHLAPIQIGRRVENPEEILSFAERIGIPIARPEKLHVTLTWRMAPVDWDLPALQPRKEKFEIEAAPLQTDLFGEGDIAVLRIISDALTERDREIVEAIGPRTDYPVFRPHISLGRHPGITLPARMHLTRPLRFGPEYRKEP